MEPDEWEESKLDLLYVASNIVIRYHPVLQVVYAEWIGAQNEVALKDAGEMMLEILQDKRCVKVLNDNTRVVGPWYHSVEWTNRDWFPRMEVAGLKYFAWVCPKDLFAQLSAKRALSQQGVVRTFYKKDEAINWLKSVQ